MARCAMAAIVAVSCASVGMADTLYVNHAAVPGGDGSTWATAYDDLQLALNESYEDANIDEIWVAEGVYLPTYEQIQGDPLSRTFPVGTEIAIVGGFAGWESSRDERDLTLHETVLSGDLNQDDIANWQNRGDNVWRVLTNSESLSTFELDGLTITSGGSGVYSDNATSGGGLYAQSAGILRNCIFRECQTRRYYLGGNEGGGAIYYRVDAGDGLGESPLWSPEETSVYWSDHAGPSMELAGSRWPSIKRLNVVTRQQDVWRMPQQVGSFGFRATGGLIAGTNSGFCSIDLETGRIEQIADPEEDNPHSRLNDGKIDRRGRYWCGSMDCQLKDKSSYIYRFDPDLTCHRCAEDFSFVCSNGIAFSPDDTRMYFGDTKGNAVYVFDFDIDEGRIDNRKLLLSLEDRKPGIIDGATVDAEGYYWFALNMGGKIIRIDPRGRIDREIDMPIPSPTCVTFGGDNYETLYVTSQQAFVTPEQLARHPRPGSLFAIHGLGVHGLPEPKFGG